MKMKPPPRQHHLLLAVLCAGAGILAGCFLNPSRLASSQETTNAASSSNSPRTGPRVIPTTDDNEPHDFKGLKRYLWRTSREGDPTVSAELARLDASALREMAVGTADELRGELDGAVRTSRYELMKAILRELYHREGIAMMEWVDALPDRGIRSHIFDEALRLVASENPVSSKRWWSRFDGADPDLFALGAIHHAVQSAVPRGADAVLEAMAAFHSSDLTGPFPDDFDFARLHAGLSRPERKFLNHGDALAHWTARDKDAAWRALKEDIGTAPSKGGTIVASIVSGAIARDGEVEGLKWAMERLRELTPEQQLSAMGAVDYGGQLTHEGITAILPECSEPQRKQLAGSLVYALREETKTFAVLDTLPRESIIQTLATLRGPSDPFLVSPADPSHFLERAATRYSFTPAERARIAKGGAHADAPF